MAATQVNSDSIGEVRRNDIDVTTTGQAVITKVIAGTNITISSTGVDAGTGDVTINSSGGGGSSLTMNTQTASYTLVSSDNGKDVQMNVASANNLTVPPNSSVAFSVGTQILVTQIGIGQTTIVPGSGVTINSSLDLKLRAQYSQVVLEKTATDTWSLSGDLEGGGKSVTLTTSAAANATTTSAKITSLDTPVGAGTWKFEYWIIYTSSVTTTGVKFSVNHTGTTSLFVANMRFVSTGTTGSTGVADQDAAINTGQITEGYATRTKNGVLGPTAGVDTINVNLLAIVEGIMIVTATGNIELYHGSETANSTQVTAGTSLILTRLS